MIKVTILNDNAPGRGLLCEHGLSYLIEINEKKILLDAGPGDVFLKNAEKLNISLSDLDMAVLSHGHWDHGNGFKYLNDIRLVAHPEVFKKRYHSNRGNDYVGLEMDQNEMSKRYKLELTKEPLELSSGCWFLGEIPRNNGFEAKSTAFVDEAGNEDFIPDDSGVAMLTKKGLVVISCCAHAGIVNTIEHAKKVSGADLVHAVMGGFHLKNANTVTQKTIENLEAMGIKKVLPSHCTDLPALSEFYRVFGMNQVRTGNVYNF